MLQIEMILLCVLGGLVALGGVIGITHWMRTVRERQAAPTFQREPKGRYLALAWGVYAAGVVIVAVVTRRMVFGG